MNPLEPDKSGSKPEAPGGVRSEQFVLTQQQLFHIDPASAQAEVTGVVYSNYAFVMVGPRDAWIDFLQVPGVPVEGKQSVATVRVYLPHVAAANLAIVLKQLLDDAVQKGRIEKLP